MKYLLTIALSLAFCAVANSQNLKDVWENNEGHYKAIEFKSFGNGNFINKSEAYQFQDYNVEENSNGNLLIDYSIKINEAELTFYLVARFENEDQLRIHVVNSEGDQNPFRSTVLNQGIIFNRKK